MIDTPFYMKENTCIRIFSHSTILFVVPIIVNNLFNTNCHDIPFIVLEFELRKAQETIKSLRASLTKEAGKSYWVLLQFN
jgi:hypothetical protein